MICYSLAPSQREPKHTITELCLGQVVPTVRGHMFVVSNKATSAKQGEYEPSLDTADSQWAASQSQLGPRAEKPWSFEDGDYASGFGAPEPTMVWHLNAAKIDQSSLSKIFNPPAARDPRVLHLYFETRFPETLVDCLYHPCPAPPIPPPPRGSN